MQIESYGLLQTFEKKEKTMNTSMLGTYSESLDLRLYLRSYKVNNISKRFSSQYTITLYPIGNKPA